MWAIRGEGGFIAHRQGQLGLRAALARNRKEALELGDDVGVSVARRAEENPLPILCPAKRLIRPRMKRQPFRFPSHRRNHIDILVAVDLSREGELRSIRRKQRGCFDARTGVQASGFAAAARDAPQIACKGEDDLCAAQGRRSQQ
jgi:hypothetical protein